VGRRVAYELYVEVELPDDRDEGAELPAPEVRVSARGAALLRPAAGEVAELSWRSVPLRDEEAAAAEAAADLADEATVSRLTVDLIDLPPGAGKMLHSAWVTRLRERHLHERRGTYYTVSAGALPGRALPLGEAVRAVLVLEARRKMAAAR
jgi:hypothetical protein